MKRKFVILRQIETSPILEELKNNEYLWDIVRTLDCIDGDRKPPGFLPLVIGVLDEHKCIKDSEGLKITDAFRKIDSVTNILMKNGFSTFSRAAFFRLKPGDTVRTHIDDGKYYLKKDRFHLSIQGSYEYTVDGETKIINPGDLFWFNNKMLHSAKNIDTVDRITFVFDVPHEDSPIRCTDGELNFNYTRRDR